MYIVYLASIEVPVAVTHNKIQYCVIAICMRRFPLIYTWYFEVWDYRRESRWSSSESENGDELAKVSSTQDVCPRTRVPSLTSIASM